MARGDSIGNPAPFAVRAIMEGTSATQALRDIREAGGAIGTQRWYRVYGEAKASIGNLTQVASLDMAQVPRDEHWVPWSAGNPGQYAYQFGIVTVDDQTGLRFTVPHTVITNGPVPIQQAADEAMATFAQGAQTGSGPGSPVDPILMNLYQMTGPVG